MAAALQVQHEWGNLNGIYGSSFHSGPELESQRASQSQATSMLRSCMATFKAADSIEHVSRS